MEKKSVYSCELLGLLKWIQAKKKITITVNPRLSGLIGTSVNSPDNRESGFIIKKMNINEIQM